MIQLEELVQWLGVEGAIAGLEASDLTITELAELDVGSPNRSRAKLKRSDLIRDLIVATRERLQKTPEELMSMSVEELTHYFVSIKASREELLSLLMKLDIRPGAAARKNLTEFAAREISDIGMYRRVAAGGSH